MDIDTQQPRLQPSHTYFRNPNAPALAIDDLSQELSTVEQSMRLESERKHYEAESKLRYNPRSHAAQPPSFALPPKPSFAATPSQPDYLSRPFQGTLPPAPMSMNRCLRNPVVPVVQYQSRAQSPPYAASSPPPPPPTSSPPRQERDDDDPDFFRRMAQGLSPVRFPERGTNAQVAPGKWVLPQDVRTTGLEERFGSVFTLDEPGPRDGEGSGGWLKGWFG